MQVTVTISDAKVVSGDDNSLITYSLGSCIGVALYDPMKKIGGLLHFQLPTSTLDSARAQQNPFMFADSGFAALLQMMTQQGADKRRLKCKIAGGAKMLADNSSFDIGRRNHAAIRKVLWQHGILCDSEDCGGTQPRTMTIYTKDGTVTLKRGAELVAMK